LGAWTAQIGRISVILQKKSSIFNEINLQSGLLSQTFLRKNPKLFPKEPAVQPPWFYKICKNNP
jgi:hypothetical protein